MRLTWWPLLIPWLPVLLVLLGGCSGTAFHSLQYFYTGISEPGKELPQFTMVGFVNDELIEHYDSNTKKFLQRAFWMEKFVEEDTHYLNKETKNVQLAEQYFKIALIILRNRFNQSEGLHTWQCMVGCELIHNQPKGRFMQCGYEGRDFINLNTETFNWMAASAEAQVTKNKWMRNPSIMETWKDYLEGECVELLRKHMDYGKKVLLRTEPPLVKMACKANNNGKETLTCRAHGFYPKEINVKWKKDGEIVEQDIFGVLVAPNSDGTYHASLRITVDSKDRKLYQCQVKHDDLREPLYVACEEPGVSSRMGMMIGCLMVAVVVAVIVGTVVYIKQHTEMYNASSRSTMPPIIRCITGAILRVAAGITWIYVHIGEICHSHTEDDREGRPPSHRRNSLLNGTLDHLDMTVMSIQLGTGKVFERRRIQEWISSCSLGISSVYPMAAWQ